MRAERCAGQEQEGEEWNISGIVGSASVRKVDASQGGRLFPFRRTRLTPVSGGSGLRMVAVIRLQLLAPLERGHRRFPSPFVRVNGTADRPRAESIPT